LSATVEVAEAASRMLPEIPIHVVDSYTAAMAQGFVVLEAARAAAKGARLEGVTKRAKEMIPKVNLLATLATLEYLQRGGRIGRAAALMGSVLKIRPILYVARDGVADVLEKPRTRAKAVRRILEIAEERVGSRPAHVAVIHADVPREAEKLREEVASRLNCVELFITDFTPVLGTHGGPGVLGLTFWAEEGDG
ncbi:MAG: DegV family protein, partial [Chloroflexota bacterium]|nr:DegV family protein [Chloroflexota bacterium]